MKICDKEVDYLEDEFEKWFTIPLNCFCEEDAKLIKALAKVSFKKGAIVSLDRLNKKLGF